MFAPTRFVFALLLLLMGGLLACATAAPPPLATPSPDPPTATATDAPSTATTLPPTAVPPTLIPTATVPPPTAVPPSLAYLGAAIDAATADFRASGGVVSLYVQDLTTSETLTRDPDIALAGMSLVKIPILLETYRVLDGEPNSYHTQLITETAALSGNYTANLLLALVSGGDDPYLGTDTVTANLRRMGLYNTFIAAPYDSEQRPGRPTTYVTPANTRLDINTRPDPNMQTTVGDLGQLLGWIYACANGRPSPLDTYAVGLTADDCTQLLQMMSLNRIDSLIESGVPSQVPIAHKHGWIGDTHGDAAVVFAPNHPYVLTIILYRPGWLEWAESSPLIAEVSRLVYTHFNDPTAAYPADFVPPVTTAVPPTATPSGPRAIIINTAGIGLRLRQQPAGAEIAILPEGSVVELLDTAATLTPDGTAWRQVRSVQGETGWVGADYLLIQE